MEGGAVDVEANGIEVDEDALEEEIENPGILGSGNDDELLEMERTWQTGEASRYGSDLPDDERRSFEGRVVVEVEMEGLDLRDVEGCCYLRAPSCGLNRLPVGL